MIPQVNESGVLPPFLPNCNPAMKEAVAPYRTTIDEFIRLYATTNVRKRLINGFLDYRRGLKKYGIQKGFQWIDGSFTEDVEKIRNRPPDDIDLITFFVRPQEKQEDSTWEEFVLSNQGIFKPTLVKEQYHCHSFNVDLNIHPLYLVRHISYLYGLFSHQRETFLWKGMLEINLEDSEDGFTDLLQEEVDHD